MEREIAYCAQTAFTDAEITELISEVDDMTARLDLLQGARLPGDPVLKMDLARSMCRLASMASMISGNLLAAAENLR